MLECCDSGKVNEVGEVPITSEMNVVLESHDNSEEIGGVGVEGGLGLSLQDEECNSCGNGVGASFEGVGDDLEVMEECDRGDMPSGRQKVNCDDDGGEGSVRPPAVGMLFRDWGEVEEHLDKFGKKEGFLWIRWQAAKSKDKTRRVAMTWRCECCGDPGAKELVDEGKKRKRRSKKCNCPVKVYASEMNKTMSWVIREVLLEHVNHTPHPSNAKWVKQYRMENFFPNIRRRLLNDTSVGVSIPKIYDCLANERGGYENMPITEKDMRDVVHKERLLKMEAGDAEALMQHFDKMKRQNRNFFHVHRLDEDGVFKDAFWADARSQAAYEEFGDVVCFDTTYLTNEYDLPFANFVGVNHHGQSTLLGCALVSHEDCDTFRWVFSQWLFCMNGKAPNGILTDEAAAMRRGLEEVMPETRHRWCIWHIFQKLPHKFRGDERYKELKEDMKKAVYDAFTVAEFESKWVEFVKKYSLQGHSWVEHLYEERHMWVPCYMRDFFWAGMRSTQRIESMHSYFDKFIGRHTRLFEFGDKYCAAVKKRVKEELDADERDALWRRKTSYGLVVEHTFVRLYTDAKFLEVQRECEKLLHCIVREEKLVGLNKFVLVVEDRVWVTPKDRNHEVLTNDYRMYCVEFDSDTKHASCDCKWFETHGILCRHVICVYQHNYVKEVPEKYIIRRWRRDVVRKHSKIPVGVVDPQLKEKVKRNDQIRSTIDPMLELADGNDETAEIAARGIQRIVDELRDWHKEHPQPPVEIQPMTSESAGLNYVSQGSVDESPMERHPIKDPPVPKRGRGRPKSTRFKGLGEPGWKKDNECKSKKSGSSSCSANVFVTAPPGFKLREDVYDKSQQKVVQVDNSITTEPDGMNFSDQCNLSGVPSHCSPCIPFSCSQTNRSKLQVKPMTPSSQTSHAQPNANDQVVAKTVTKPASTQTNKKPTKLQQQRKVKGIEIFNQLNHPPSFIENGDDELLMRHSLSFEGDLSEGHTVKL